MAVKNANVRAGLREQRHEADMMAALAKAIRDKRAKKNPGQAGEEEQVG